MTRTTLSPAAAVARSATSLLTSRLAVAAIALAFLGVSTRLLTIEEMAVFAVYNTFCGALTVVCSLGILASCIKQVPGLLASGRTAEASSLLRTAGVVYTAGALTVTAVLWAAAAPLGRLFLKTDAYAAEMRIAAVAALCFGIYEASQLLLSALQRFGRLSAYNAGSALAQRTVSLGLFLAFGLKGYIAGFAIGSLAGAALGFRIIARFMIRPDGMSGEASAARHVRYALPFYADGYLRYLYMHADQLIVGVFLSPESLSIYFVAKRFIQYGQVLVSSLVDPLGAKISELRQVDADSVTRAFSISLRYVVLAFVPLSALLAAASPFLLWMIGGARYAAGVAPLALLFLSLPFFATFSHLATFVYILGEPRDRFLNNLVSVFAQGIAVAALMPVLGLTGLALARVAGFGAASIAAGRRARRHLPGGPAPAPIRGAFRCVLPSALMAACVVLPHLLVDRVALIPIYVAPALAVGAAGYLLFVLTPADRRALASTVPGGGSLSRRMRSLIEGERPPGATTTPI